MAKGAYEKGLAGEDLALEYLTDRGMVLLHRRYHSPFGEIDLIMRDGDAIALIEVKIRSTGSKGDGLMAITRAKQRRIVMTARYYLAETRTDCLLRFDALEITPQGILYVQGAFDAGAWF